MRRRQLFIEIADNAGEIGEGDREGIKKFLISNSPNF